MNEKYVKWFWANIQYNRHQPCRTRATSNLQEWLHFCFQSTASIWLIHIFYNINPKRFNLPHLHWWMASHDGPYMIGLQSHSSWNLDWFSLGVLFIRDNLGRGWRCFKISSDRNKMWQHIKIVALGVAEVCERPRSSYLGGVPEWI